MFYNGCEFGSFLFNFSFVRSSKLEKIQLHVHCTGLDLDEKSEYKRKTFKNFNLTWLKLIYMFGIEYILQWHNNNNKQTIRVSTQKIYIKWSKIENN